MMFETYSDMKDKLCIVTGSNSGVGKETSRKLVAAGAELVMVCRNSEKAEAVKKEFLEAKPEAIIHVFIADLSLMSEVRRVAKELLDAFNKIDLLVNNAGGHWVKKETTTEGNEMNIAVNFLAPFLLTNLLIDRLKESAPARVVNVASEAHRIGSLMTFKDYQNDKSLTILAYMRSKFYLMLFTDHMGKKLEGSGVSINSVCPGLVASNFFDVQPFKAMLKQLAKAGIFTINTPEKGARSSIIAATHPDYMSQSGRFIASYPLLKRLPPMANVRNEQYQQDIWAFAESATKAA